MYVTHRPPLSLPPMHRDSFRGSPQVPARVTSRPTLQSGRRWMRLSTPALKHGSQRWLQNQASDPFVVEARRQGYIARSAFKLIDIDDKLGLIQKGRTRVAVDLGCSPGGWCQVIRERAGDACHIFGLDRLRVKATLTNATILEGDFNDAAVKSELRRHLEAYAQDRPTPTSCTGAASGDGPGAGAGVVDLVTSDMCPNRMGGAADRHRIASLHLDALRFSIPFLSPTGHFVCKVLGGRNTFASLYEMVETNFSKAVIVKPPASRVHSDEAFLVGYSKLSAPRRVRGTPGSGGGHGGGGEGGGTYDLDDWPGFVHRPRSGKSRTPRASRGHHFPSS